MNNPELDLAFDFVQYTNRNIFLTGKAGTGKTTFLHNLRKVSPKRMIVVAPTGVAAINAGGVTIHSFFQMPFGPILPGRLDARERSEDKFKSFQRFNKRKINIIRSLDLLVIDEISMVRADLLDGIDHVLRRFKNRTKPFGGVQLLMIGDLQQLAPVVKEDEWNLLRDYYDTFYFFSSKAFKQSRSVSIELKHVYRQQDSTFINILNEIRDDRLSAGSIELLNQRYKPGFRPENEEGYITLTTHNAIANRINEEQLQKVGNKAYTFEAEVKDNFPEFSYPADEFLTLKEGAQVMFIKNDSSPEKRYYNGKIGTITEIDEEVIYVKSKYEDFQIEVGRETWENVKYTIDDRTKEITEDVAGSFTQYPLRLAWAITIHKSQGLTFEKAVIDAQAAFAHGQTYVALSRCKSLEGLVLSTRISQEGIICDPTVGKFNSDVEANQPDENKLSEARRNYMIELFEELFSYRQMQYYVDKLKKITAEHKNSIIGDVGIKLDEVLVKGTRPLNNISEKFIGQLRYLINSPDAESQFFDRIKKGAAYFLEQTNEHIEKPLREADFETDNKAVRTLVREATATIKELLTVKQRCLEHCKKGFVLKEYLWVRAVAALEPAPVKKTEKEKTAKEISSSEHPVLYEKLRQWRNARAQEEEVPHYRVISQRAILGISNELPGNDHQLLKVKGLGRKKVSQYGEEILEIVREYCNNNDLAATMALPEKKQPKKNTKEVTFDLFLSGMDLPSIAAERQMAVSTIEGHLAHFIGNGKLDIHLLIDDKTLETISEYFYEFPESSLAQAKQALGDSISYGELRMVRASMPDDLNI